MEFLIGGSAAVCAGFFTNPLEVLKTRMQLQGELSAKGQHVVHYKNILDASVVIVRNEGIVGLQKGLVPALYVQFIMNGFRFGTYQFAANRGFLNDSNGAVVFYKNVLVSGCGGVVGHLLSNPFFMVKTHLQSQSAQAIAVGHQHFHKGSFQAMSDIVKNHGVKGLYRGGVAVIPRAFVASVSQLSAFTYSKKFLNQYEYLDGRKLLVSFLSSLIGGTAISVMVTPFDLILTRLYNQPVNSSGKGELYTSYVDTVLKIYRTEGITAFYKGFGPIYFRLGPHSVLSLMFWDKFQEFYES